MKTSPNPPACVAAATPDCARALRRCGESARRRPVWFLTWFAALRQLRRPAHRHQTYRLALIRSRRFCQETHQRATVESARAIFESVQEQRMLSRSLFATWKAAINWFFKARQKSSTW